MHLKPSNFHDFSDLQCSKNRDFRHILTSLPPVFGFPLRSKDGLDFSKLLTRGGALLIRVKPHSESDAPTARDAKSRGRLHLHYR